MNDRQWNLLFDLIERCVNLPGMTADEKGQKVRDMAAERQQSVNLEEFIAQVGSED